ncbi:nitrogen fixation protein NifQ [Vibrio astriarenae]
MHIARENAIWQTLFNGHEQGHSSLPYLGLDFSQFEKLALDIGYPAPPSTNHEIELLFNDIVSARRSEQNDLIDLLIKHSDGELVYSTEMAWVISAGCLMPSHLWKTLGLPSRQVLSQLIETYFPTLFQQNNLNMRWKQFFYKKLCDQHGDYVCKAPNCLECSSFNECFAA